MFRQVLILGALRAVWGGVLFPDLPQGVPGVENTTCGRDVGTFRENLKNFSLWAFEMSDASGVSARGRLPGNMYDFGNFEECLRVEVPIKGKYCLVTIVAKNVPEIVLTNDEHWAHFQPMESVLRKIYRNGGDKTTQARDLVQIGWCVPASCGTAQLQSSLSQYLQTVDHIFKTANISFEAIVREDLCQTRQPETFGPIEQAFTILTGAIILVVSSATFIDFIKRKQETKSSNKFLKIFSAIDNTSSLGEANYDSGFNILNGMKFVGIIFVFVGHVACFAISFNADNQEMIEHITRSPLNLFFNTQLFVDSFFVAGGFLMAYKMIKARGKNPLMYILMRYISLTPSYAYIIFFNVVAMKFLGNGPFWKTVVSPGSQACADNWWANLLYIGNYYDAEHLCLIQSWYLNCDFHYFIAGLLIMYVIKYNEKIGRYLLLLTLVIFTVVPTAIAYIYKLQLINTFAINEIISLPTSPNFTEMYIKSHNRAQPYIIGMIGGCFFRYMEANKKTMKVVESYILLILSTLVLLLTMFSGAYFFDIDYVYDDVTESLYLGLYRIFWALGTVGLFTYANFGNSLFLKSILGSKLFTPLGKLIYGAYLTHMIFVTRRLGITSTTWNYDMFDMALVLFGYMVGSFISAYFLYICIEAPVKMIYRILTTNPKRKESTDAAADTNGHSTHI